MGDVVQFVPRAEREASGNLADFIRLAKEGLTAFANGGAWDRDKWQQNETIVVFATKTAPLNSYSFTPFVEPFMQFAKAYIRYRYSHRPVKSLAMMLQALRCVEAGLLAACGRGDVGLLSGAVMDVCANKCKEFYSSEDVHHKTGLQLQAVFDFLREKSLVPSLPAWKSPFKKPVILTEDLGEAGQAHRMEKLPTNEAMLAVADVFAQADDRESQFYSSIFILLMAAPGRVSEVLKLPIDCIQWEEDDDGNLQMFLRWNAAKGKGATRKWVVPVMHDVVKEAVRRLIEIGAPARELVRAAFEGSTSSSEDVGTSNLIKEFGGFYWPFLDEKRVLTTWSALCLHRENEFSREKEIRPDSWRIPNANEVNKRLGAGSGHGESLFDRMGLRNLDGTRITLTSHQLRHWLSTMSERAGMDDYSLARWAGRAKVSDNRHYDHRSPEERLEAARGLLPMQPAPLLERIKQRQPVTYQELGTDRLGTAKATLYGMCVHDYAMAPCQKQRECMTCKEHVCIKGDHVALDRIRLLEAQTEKLLQQAMKAHEDGDFGADRWVDNHKWKLAHVKAMRIALEHPNVLEGAVLRIPDGHDPSPVRRALMDLGVVEVPSMDALGPKMIALALT
ncbi:hypothetical protein I5U05_010115 [Stenotrophomonas maltophilia]|uniref:hypothetical protein n=1 Tax=unclassified Stenotrophomonas TaxID=196198 RepID=UPI0013103582|nr:MULTISPECIES: hypothetical protein [unclassified Stenotrophomonas]MBH1609384.1 hypothetical protein [Stenotrophomonas maltophilia]MBH1725216.1 hypothetical protein [Stenotrophomonas maltophilia]MBH1798053.1 hypothetical protein [Stenotrophomonas maltophilia]MBH1805302.1 hypothetical protein [Stenotrophomonas maltophilia]HEL4216995.1 hypothetical protein [Stenotrophomonas maltophilia]